MATAIGITVAACGGGLVTVFAGRRSLKMLKKDEQLRVETNTDVLAINGPGLKFVLPFYKTQIVKATTLGPTEYVKVKDTIKGSERVEQGPQLVFLGPYDQMNGNIRQGISLGVTDYVLIEDQSTGEKRVEKGPKVWFPGPQESGDKRAGVNLSDTEFVLIEDSATGKRRVERGPQVWFPGPLEKGTRSSAVSLSSTEYVLVVDKQTSERRVEKGPMVWFPAPYEAGAKGQGKSLTSTDYVLVENSVTGEKRVDKGPCVWFPAPNEEGVQGSAISLGKTEYIHVEDKLTGEKRLIQGPCTWFPNPYDESSSVMAAVSLMDDEYIKLKDIATGRRWVQKGKALLFLEPTWRIEVSSVKDSGVRKACVLKAYEQVRIIDTITGKVTCHNGEATIIPGPDDDFLDGSKMPAIDLKVNEYVKLLDQASGDIRVESGAAQVFLGPHEKVLDGGKQKGVTVDDEHAVLVRDKQTGQLRLVTEKQLFFPGPHETIEEVRDLIKLADHEALIIKDKDGHFQYYYGSDAKRSTGQARSFFLPPYAEIVQLCWSRGRRREKRDLYISRFDCRAQYMSFEFNCRTKDNVELVLEGTFFWEVVDLPLMVSTTGDTSGDICNHARSQFIKHVARVTLKEFMDDMNVISNKVFEEDVHFYSSRGVKAHSLEVTRYQCADQSTAEVLQQIIQETTNRMNRLSQAESENEVKLFKMQGQIEQEKLNGDLLEIQHQHSESEARVAGVSEAERVTAFLTGLEKTVPKLEDRVAMWQTLRKTDALSVLSQGNTSLYYTPNDVNLSIETRAPSA